MAYWIKNTYEETSAIYKTFKISGSVIEYIGEKGRDKTINLDTSNFTLRPGHVVLDNTIFDLKGQQERKYHWQQLIKKGCTTVICLVPVKFKKDLTEQLRIAKGRLADAPIDHTVAPSVQPKTLTLSFFREIIKQQLPFLHIEVPDINALHSIPWQWLRIHAGPRPPAISITLLQQVKDKEFDKHLQSIEFPLLHAHAQNVFLTKSDLQMMGLYPQKGGFIVRGDVDYLLYYKPLKNEESHSITHDTPEVVVLRGEVLKAGESIHYRPGFGKECNIFMPGQFKTYSSNLL